MTQTFRSDYTSVGRNIQYGRISVIFDFSGRQATGEELFGIILDSTDNVKFFELRKFLKLYCPFFNLSFLRIFFRWVRTVLSAICNCLAISPVAIAIFDKRSNF